MSHATGEDDEHHGDMEMLLADVDVKVSIVERQSLTIPHRVPKDQASIGKRQQKTLPCFTCLVHFFIGPTEVIVAGQANGDIIQWKVPQNRSMQFGAPLSAAASSNNGPATPHLLVGSHKGNVTCIAYIESHKLVLSGSSDCTIKLWDMSALDSSSSSRCIQTLNAHDATVTAIAVHCNLIISGSIDKTLKVWKFDENREGLGFPWAAVRQVFIFESWVTSLWASPKKIAETSQGEVFAGDAAGGVTVLRSIVVHDDEADNVVATHIELLRHLPSSSDKRQAITRLLPIPNLNLCISLSFDSAAVMSDIVGFQPLVRIPHPTEGRYTDCVWDPSTEEVILLDAAGMLFVWDTRSNKMRCGQNVGHTATALIRVGGRGGVGVRGTSLDPASQRPAVMWMAEREAIRSMTVERTSSVVEHQGHTGRIIGLNVHNIARSGGGGGDSSLAHSPSRAAAAAAPEEIDFFLATASVDNTICLWTANMTLLKQYKEKYSEISTFLAIPALSYLVTGHDNGSLKFWSLTKDKTFRFGAHDNTISGVYEGFHRYGHGGYSSWHHLFTISYDGCLAVWDVPVEGSKAKCDSRIRVSNSELICAAYDEIKKCYVVGGNNGDITMWSVDELKPISQLAHPASAMMKTPAAHREAVTCLGFDGNYVFSGGEDEALYLWNTVNGDLVKTLQYQCEDDMGEVQQFVVLPDSGDLLVCTRAGLVVIFSQETGYAISSYALSKEVSTIGYSRSTEEIIAGLDDGVILRIRFGMMTQLPPPMAAAMPAADGADGDSPASSPFKGGAGDGLSSRGTTPGKQSHQLQEMEEIEEELVTSP